MSRSPIGPTKPLPAVLEVIAGDPSRAQRSDVEPALAKLVAYWCNGDRVGSQVDRYIGARNVRRVLDWLERQPGDTWAERWSNSGANEAGPSWAELAGSSSRIITVGMTYACHALMVTRMIGPTREFYRSSLRRRLPDDWAEYHQPELFAQVISLTDQVPTPNIRRQVLRELVEMCCVSGKPLDRLDREDVLELDAYLRATKPHQNVRLCWHFMKAVGLLPDEPDDFAQVIASRRESVHEMIDRYRVEPEEVRDLFVAYLTEREASGADYSALRHFALTLSYHFWGDIKAHHPEQKDLRLTPEQARDWISRLKVKPDGTPRRDWAMIVGAIRGLYVDVALLANDDPAVWARWAMPSPISSRAVRAGYTAERAHLQARMYERTRSLEPHLPRLLASVAEHQQRWERITAACAAVAPGATFVVDDQPWTRAAHSPRYTPLTMRAVDPDGSRVNLTQVEHQAFWTWACLQLLRHTGLRNQEMLSLTHLSIQPFRKPNGEILPLLQVAPSKTDMERVLPVGPELAHVLGRIIQRVAQPNGALPLLRRFTAHKKTFSAPMPFLFQQQHANGRRTVLDVSTSRKYLQEAAARADLRFNDGSPVRFTPHDFRRLFSTEVVRYGMPIHIAAQLLGHKDLNTTRGYTAVYPLEVFQHFEDHLARSRAERPSEEYRTPTAAEIAEFAEHFGRRRVELGDCVRPYGTGCSHEHACIRCDFLQVTPDAAPRMDAIEVDLHRRQQEATSQAWLGDVEQLKVTLERLRTKRETLPAPSQVDAPMLMAQPEVSASALHSA